MAKKRGVGMACIFYGMGYGNGFPDVSSAIVEVHDDGTATVRIGAADCGQGSSTVMAQIAAEELGIEVDDVTVVSEDTDATPDAGTSAATRQTYVSGNTVRRAASEARQILFKKALPELGVNTLQGLAGAGGFIYVKGFPQKKISIKELAFKARLQGLRIVGEGSFTAHSTKVDMETGQGAPYWPYAFATQIVEVEVDTLTGMVEVLKVTAAHDVGKAVNPVNVEGQIAGGICQGLGMALLEEVELNMGKIKNPLYSKYLIPTIADVPDIDPYIVESPEPTGPYGAKGVGEPALLPAAPAVINAIYDAVGVRLTSLPATPEKVLKAMEGLKGQEKL
ncbi:MAG: molybdopterin cofactor-binding domain-containing protein [Bacillota bacterium]